MSYGISTSFPVLSRLERQVAHALLTRPPLKRSRQAPIFSVRLECVMHAASVHPEPGSNSRLKSFILAIYLLLVLIQELSRFLVAKFPQLPLYFLILSYFVLSSLSLFNFQGSFLRLFQVPSFWALNQYTTFYLKSQGVFWDFFSFVKM